MSLIIVDEFHHAAANSYQKLFQYFRPQFFLGLTATPFRTDNRDILGLCDDNIIYEIYLRDSINRGYLVPFSYYGFYDETDYSVIPYQNGSYQLDILELALSNEKRSKLVMEKYKQYAGEKVIGFCAGIKHAEFMAEFFTTYKIPACVTHSGSSLSKHFVERSHAISGLKLGTFQVVFCVDLFNEGVDIPEIDTVLFLRPTESTVVFLQQLGRGLRKYEGKAELTVLDFIGNYKRAHHIPFLLAGKNPLTAQDGKGYGTHEVEYPDGCFVNFDFRLIDLFIEMRKSDPLKKRLQDEYWRIHREVGRRPTRMDIYLGSDIPFKHYLRDDGWYGFLKSIGELREEEETWLHTPVPNFLREIERTSMSKSYKIPTLLCFVDDDNNWVSKVEKSDLVKSWRSYYSDSVHNKDMLRDESSKNWVSWNDDRLANLAIKNPVYYLSHTPYFHYDEVNKIFYIDDSLTRYLTPKLAMHYKDILNWRTHNYFAKRYREDALP